MERHPAEKPMKRLSDEIQIRVNVKRQTNLGDVAVVAFVNGYPRKIRKIASAPPKALRAR